MASRLFFDPVVALRTAPLVSSTCTLFYAFSQDFFLRIFNHADLRKENKSAVSPYFKIFFCRGLPIVLSLLSATTSTTVANLYTQPSSLRNKGAYSWYMAAAIFSASHILFVPFVPGSVKRLVENEKDTDANDTLDEWLSVNALRGLTVDLVAWVACVVAVGKSLVA
ncbi:related to integral membrane protein [Cephalotrichum gorgonifer]|uniref:Related to integral membrane protein n=1 Tax=Cephalotrichum gorgonifer TaxID=2041049 RepID=A0AAE8SS17_9PEZI|nr:related to integral membrane protein [Cephalotrichum gorgonifer]